jgi:hypothetical protein
LKISNAKKTLLKHVIFTGAVGSLNITKSTFVLSPSNLEENGQIII